MDSEGSNPSFSNKELWTYDLGNAVADLSVEFPSRQSLRLQGVEVIGRQLLNPSRSVEIEIPLKLTPEDHLALTISGSATLTLPKQRPVKCILKDVKNGISTWRALAEPLINLKESKPGNRLEFWLFGFPDFFSSEDQVVQETCGSRRQGLIRLTYRDWQIEISAHELTPIFVKNHSKDGAYYVTHLGSVKKLDESQFTWADAKPFIECLHQFLSFARGFDQPLGKITLLSEDGAPLCQLWGIMRGSTSLTDLGTSWWCPHHANQLSGLFPCFCKTWFDENWSDPLKAILYWYLQSNQAGRGNLNCDAALILSQAGLEKLSYTYATQQLLSEDAFNLRKLRASDQIRLLAKELGLPDEIPDYMKSDSTAEFADAFHLITEVRNHLTHPKEKWNFPKEIYYNTWNLAQWYLELCLLRVMGYQGEYANRLRSEKWRGVVEPLPCETRALII